MKKLIRITTVPLSLEKLLEGQLNFMEDQYKVIAVSAEESRLEKFGRDNGLETFCVEMTREITPWRDLKALRKLYGFLKKEKPLIVHTHTPKAGIIGMLAARLAGVPIRLHTVAGMPLMETVGAKRKILNKVEKLTYSCATKVYPNSVGLKDFILKEELAKPAKIKVLGKGSSNGIDTSYFDASTFSGAEKTSFRQSLGIPIEDTVFVFVGRLVADKGINELVLAFRELEKEHKKVSLLLVGPFEQELDPIEEEVMEEIERNAKIVSVGFQKDVRPYFAISDVLSFPSYREGFPNVVMQAGAMGLPSIVSDINGCNEIIEEGVNGTIIPAKDQSALYGAMRRMVEDPVWRKKLESNSRDKITRNYERLGFWNTLLEEYKIQEEELQINVPLFRKNEVVKESQH